MKVSIDFLKRNFDRFNKEIFKDQLPPITLAICNTRGKMGYFLTETLKDRRTGISSVQSLSIRLSSCFDLPEEEWEDVLIHEMMHYYIYTKNLKDSSPHGVLFKKLMNGINQHYGRHITISRKSEVKQTETTRSRRRIHIFAIIRFKDGEVGLKVLTRSEDKLIAFRDALSRAPKVASVDFYVSNDAFFDDYPHSTSLRYHPINEAKLAPHMKETLRLVYKGGHFEVE